MTTTTDAVLEIGQSVRFSEKGRAKVQSMPEAWGLHRALYGEEVGEVIDYLPPEEDDPARACVDFPSGGAYNWGADCFQSCETQSPEGGA